MEMTWWQVMLLAAVALVVVVILLERGTRPRKGKHEPRGKHHRK